MGKFRSQKRKKPQFRGNRYTAKKAVAVSTSNDLPTASSSKLRDVLDAPPASKDEDHLTGNRVIDIELLSGIFDILCCPLCFSCSLILKEISKFGLSSHLQLNCNECDFSKDFFTSKKVGRVSEINIRLVYGLRQIGRAFSSANKLCATLNLPSPPQRNAYKGVELKLLGAASTVAQESMTRAADEIKTKSAISTDDPIPCAVSVDGTWQRRGYTSLNGVVSVISIDTGKLLDIEAMSMYCRTCRNLKKFKNDNIYQSSKADHVCGCNYEGSSGNMEVVGATRIFNRSGKKLGLHYTQYFGDGDCKAFSAVKDTYRENSVEKHECIGHIQKRVGARLRNLKKKTRGLGGRGKLTDAFINRLQNYYGIAIRSNVGDLKAMQQATISAFFHCASSSSNLMHGQCSLGSDSWCNYQRAIANNEPFTEKNVGLFKEVIKHVRPVFMELCGQELLSKCLKGKTQNQNESFNGKLWEVLPKEAFVSLQTLRFGAFVSVMHFNDGFNGSLRVLNVVGITDAGFYTTQVYKKLDINRINCSKYHSTPEVKKTRKILRAVRKNKTSCIENKEGVTYKAGEF